MATRRSAPWREKHFEQWFARDPRLPDGERLLLVGRHQALRRMVDLIALDQNGGLVILEVKNESSNRRAIGQALEYLSQYDELDFDELAEEFEDSEGGDLRGAFQARFGREIDKATTRRRVYLVAPAHDAYSAVCTQYLSRHLREGIEFHLVTAARDGGGFRIQDFACPVLKRLRELEKGFALNPRGRRLFYVIEPGGRLQQIDAALETGRPMDIDSILADILSGTSLSGSSPSVCAVCRRDLTRAQLAQSGLTASRDVWGAELSAERLWPSEATTQRRARGRGARR